MKKGLPLGIDNFQSLICRDCYYVDKTPFIRTILEDGGRVQLITRPRRFGKTLFMDTLKCFLQIDFRQPGKADRQVALFAGLKIAESSDFCRRFMGQHPVISLSLKDVEGENYAAAYRKLAERLASVAATYDFLLDSPHLTELEKAAFRRCRSSAYLQDLSHVNDCQHFLENLTVWLSKHFKRQVVLLIDDYDAPLWKAARLGYDEELLDFLRPFLGAGVREEAPAEAGALPYLMKAVLTGCLRLSNKSLFEGFDQLDANTVCSDDRTLNAAVGFTADEVQALLAHCGLEARWPEVRRWCGSYRLAGAEIYCPEDVLNFCQHAAASERPLLCRPERLGADANRNDVIEAFLRVMTSEEASRLQTLVDGGTADLEISGQITCGDLAENRPIDFWTLLLFAGCLTAGLTHTHLSFDPQFSYGRTTWKST